MPIAVARLQAGDAPSAVGRVRAALGEEPFTVEEAVPEDEREVRGIRLSARARSTPPYSRSPAASRACFDR